MKKSAFVVVGGLLLLPHQGMATEIWLSAVDPVIAHDRNSNAPDSDYMDLFRPNARWAKAAGHVKIFKVSTQFLHRATDTQLHAVIDDLRARYIAVAMEAEIMVTSVRCGNGIPGFTTTNVIRKAIDRVRNLGGQIDYVAFDEPIAFGHLNRHPGSCGFSIEELVQNIAPNIQAIKTAFPHVAFGDIEPVADNTFGRLDRILEFARVFHEQTGEKLAFVQADIIWQNRWQPQLVEWRNRLHAAGIRFGVIFDGDPGDNKTEVAWTAHAVERYRQVMSDSQVAPAEVVFQSWQSRPTRVLPEDQPGTLTSVVVQAVGSERK